MHRRGKGGQQGSFSVRNLLEYGDPRPHLETYKFGFYFSPSFFSLLDVSLIPLNGHQKTQQLSLAHTLSSRDTNLHSPSLRISRQHNQEEPSAVMDHTSTQSGTADDKGNELEPRAKSIEWTPGTPQHYAIAVSR